MAAMAFAITINISPKEQVTLREKEEHYEVEPKFTHCHVCKIGVLSYHNDGVIRCSHCGNIKVVE